MMLTELIEILDIISGLETSIWKVDVLPGRARNVQPTVAGRLFITNSNWWNRTLNLSGAGLKVLDKSEVFSVFL